MSAPVISRSTGNAAVALGIDIGTSGVRAAALAATGECVAIASASLETTTARRDPAAWWRAVQICLAELRARACLADIGGVAIDGTSGTMLAIDADGAPVGAPLMYNDPCSDPAIVSAIDRVAPPDSPARGKNSALARAVLLSRHPETAAVVHQADWIAIKLAHGAWASDENNALKTGYDLQARGWPDWLEAAGMDRHRLPPVEAAGMPLNRLGAHAARWGLPPECLLHAGTTDGCASFLATGARAIGDAVTALGSTLVVKLACERAVNAPEYGIYSHRIGSFWLAGGASNTGGAVIRALVGDDDHLAKLAAQIDPKRPTGLDYYPLTCPGERFPINDPDHAPRHTPRPDDEALFFQAILEGITQIEKAGYDRLQTLGAPPLRSVRTVGGGAKNPAWTEMRKEALGVPFLQSRATEAAVGAAMLVLNHRQPAS